MSDKSFKKLFKTSDGMWVMEISSSGQIKFNHKEIPSLEDEEFALKFVDLIKKICEVEAKTDSPKLGI